MKNAILFIVIGLMISPMAAQELSTSLQKIGEVLYKNTPGDKNTSGDGG